MARQLLKSTNSATILLILVYWTRLCYWRIYGVLDAVILPLCRKDADCFCLLELLLLPRYIDMKVDSLSASTLKPL
jgi:hypothetical protein